MSTITIQCFNWHFGIEFDIISNEEENDNYARLDDNKFGVTFCVICGKLGTGFADTLQDNESLLIIK